MKNKLYPILSVLLVFLLLSSCTFRNNPELKSTESNLTTVSLELPISLEELQSSKVDKIAINSYLIDEMGMPVRSCSTEITELAGLTDNTVNYDLGYFGKHEITMQLYSGNTVVAEKLTDYILTSDEYNIAYLHATLPVTYFSLMISDKDTTYLNANAPSVVVIERAAAYDWNNLLPNMYGCPFIEESKLENSSTTKSIMQEALTQLAGYIKYLHELNENSVFHIFVTDNFSDSFIELALETNVNFDLTMYSDGSNGTYGTFRSVYGQGGENDNSSQIYDEISSVWNTVKVKARSGDRSWEDDLKVLYDGSDYRKRACLPPVLINDPDFNARWVVGRNDDDVFGASSVYYTKIQSNPNVIAVNLNTNLLAVLTAEETKAFQTLYKFDSSVFEEADNTGKKIMIFLGTRNDENLCLEQYISFMKNYCELYLSEDYVYYYKGHPGDPSEFNATKNAILEKYDVISLDASIPAELFLFFRSDADVGGYSSSTFASYTKDEIPFICGQVSSNTEGYTDKINTNITQDNGSTSNFTITRRKDGTTSKWDFNNPTVFDFITSL